MRNGQRRNYRYLVLEEINFLGHALSLSSVAHSDSCNLLIGFLFFILQAERLHCVRILEDVLEIVVLLHLSVKVLECNFGSLGAAYNKLSGGFRTK